MDDGFHEMMLKNIKNTSSQKNKNTCRVIPDKHADGMFIRDLIY
jgi:hypothetical protein